MIYDVDLRPHDVVWKYDQYWENKLNKKEVQQSQMDDSFTIHVSQRGYRISDSSCSCEVRRSQIRNTDTKNDYSSPDGSGAPIDAPSNISKVLKRCHFMILQMR